MQCVHPFLACNECYIVRMIGPCNRQWHRLKMSVDVEYIPSYCIEKMHLHAAIFDLPMETEVVNEPMYSAEISRGLTGARPRFELSIPVMQDESLNMRLQQARPIRERHGDLICTV